MKKTLLFFMFITLAHPLSYADEGFQLKSSDYISQKSFELKNSRGVVHVVIHSKGHLQGMPYVVTLKPACQGSAKSVEELETLDAKSACAVDIKSLKMNDAKTEVSINIHSPSLESYNKQIKMTGAQVYPECETKAVTHTFSVKDFCL